MADTATDHEVIDFIENLFTDPRRWIKGTSARDAFGYKTSSTSPEAACFCLGGALERYATSSLQRGRLTKLVQKFAPNHYSSIPGFNDAKLTTIDDVRHVLKSVKLHLKHS